MPLQLVPDYRPQNLCQCSLTACLLNTLCLCLLNTLRRCPYLQRKIRSMTSWLMKSICVRSVRCVVAVEQPVLRGLGLVIKQRHQQHEEEIQLKPHQEATIKHFNHNVRRFLQRQLIKLFCPNTNRDQSRVAACGLGFLNT